MALTGETLGGVWVDVHANTSEVEPEMRAGLKKAGEEIEHEQAPKIGHDVGNAMGKGIGDKLESLGPEFGRDIERGLSRTTPKISPHYEHDRNSVSRFVAEEVKDIERAFADASGPGGPLNKLGQALADAIGSGFNVSGKSPLIGFLIPLVGAIVGLVGAAIQGVSALVAYLTAIPALIAGIGLQVGALYLVFSGLGEKIQAAFAATNPTELAKALDGLGASTAKFVQSLLPLRDFFKNLKADTQEAFFNRLGVLFGPGGSLQPLLESLRNILVSVGGALGQFFGKIAAFFGSPQFISFVKDLTPQLLYWIGTFGDAITTLLRGLTAIGDSAGIRMLASLGNGFVNIGIQKFGEWLERIAKDPDFQTWLDQMITSFDHLTDALGAIINFFVTFAAVLNTAGGDKLLTTLTEALVTLTDFLTSPIGYEAMKGLVSAGIAGLAAFAALVIALLGVVAAIQFMGEAIAAFISWLIGTAAPAIGDFFTMIGAPIKDFIDGILHAIGVVVSAVVNFLEGLVGGVIKAFFDVLGRIIGIWTTIRTTVSDAIGEIRANVVGFFANAGDWLVQAGKNIVQGFINGVKSMFGAVGDAFAGVARTAANFLVSHSPIKEGPLSGGGDPKLAGQNIVSRLAEGLMEGIPELRGASMSVASNVVFGPGSIQVGFNGALPTSAQAQGTGAAIANGMNSILARDTRLSVRTLAPAS